MHFIATLQKTNQGPERPSSSSKITSGLSARARNWIKMSSLVLNDKHIPRTINGTWKGKLLSNTIKYFLMTKSWSQKKKSSRCWMWLLRDFLVIKPEAAVLTAWPCRNCTSFSLRTQGEIKVLKAFVRDLKSLYCQRYLLTPKTPWKTSLHGLIVEI